MTADGHRMRVQSTAHAHITQATLAPVNKVDRCFLDPCSDWGRQRKRKKKESCSESYDVDNASRPPQRAKSKTFPVECLGQPTLPTEQQPPHILLRANVYPKTRKTVRSDVFVYILLVFISLLPLNAINLEVYREYIVKVETVDSRWRSAAEGWISPWFVCLKNAI